MGVIKGFTIYEEYVDLISLLPYDEQAFLLKKIVDYVFYDIEPFELTENQNKVWKNLKRPIDISKKRSLIGSKGAEIKKANNQANEEANNQANEEANEEAKFKANNEAQSKMSMSMSNVYMSNVLNIIKNYQLDINLKGNKLTSDFKNYLTNNGFTTSVRVPVGSNGSLNSSGKIEIVAKYFGLTIAIEIDGSNPQGKSIYKLRNFKSDMKFILLTKNNKVYDTDGIHVVGLMKVMERKKTPDYEEEFEKLWSIYPNKKGKTIAMQKYSLARKQGATYEEVRQGLEHYIKYCETIEKKFIKHGSTWFSQKCWMDEYTETSNIPAWFEKETKDEPLTAEEEKELEEALNGLFNDN